MSRLWLTPYARAAMGAEMIEAVRTRIPLGTTLNVGAEKRSGPWHVQLVVDGKPVYDEWHRDIDVGCGEALALLPTDLEAQLAASLRAVGQ